jgi:hypothetical protein
MIWEEIMLTGREQERLQQLESIPPGRRSAEEWNELQQLRMKRDSDRAGFVSRDPDMPDDDETGSDNPGFVTRRTDMPDDPDEGTGTAG